MRNTSRPKAGANADSDGGAISPTGDKATDETDQPGAGKPEHDGKGKHEGKRGQGKARDNDKSGVARAKR